MKANEEEKQYAGPGALEKNIYMLKKKKPVRIIIHHVTFTADTLFWFFWRCPRVTDSRPAHISYARVYVVLCGCIHFTTKYV